MHNDTSTARLIRNNKLLALNVFRNAIKTITFGIQLTINQIAVVVSTYNIFLLRIHIYNRLRLTDGYTTQKNTVMYLDKMSPVKSVSVNVWLL